MSSWTTPRQSGKLNAGVPGAGTTGSTIEVVHWRRPAQDDVVNLSARAQMLTDLVGGPAPTSPAR